MSIWLPIYCSRSRVIMSTLFRKKNPHRNGVEEVERRVTMVHERLKRLEGLVTSIIRKPDLEALKHLQEHPDLIDDVIELDCTTLTNHCICTVNFEYLNKPEHLIKCLRKGQCFHCQRYQHMCREYITVTASTRLLLLAASLGKFKLFKYLHQNGRTSLETKTGVHELRSLHLSIIHGHFNIFSYLLANNVDINATIKSNGTEFSPLMQAVIYNRKDMIRHLLMVDGIDLSFRNSLSQSPLLFAVQHDNLDLIDLLLEAEEVFINRRKGRSHKQTRKLQHPCAVLEAIKHDNPTVLKILLENGCDPDFVFKGYHNFTTASILAAIKNSHRCLKILVSRGADTSTQIEGYSASDWANQLKWTKCVTVLDNTKHKLHGPDNILNCDGNIDIGNVKPIDINARTEVQEINDQNVNIINNSTDKDISTLSPILGIWNLVQWLDMDVEIRRLAKLGNDINVRDQFGRTSLHLAVEEQHVNGVRALIKSGADTEIRDVCGATPFWHAVFWNKESMIKELIAANARLECEAGENAYKLGHTSRDNALGQNNDADRELTKTPLQNAVEKNFHETVALLIEAGYDTSDDNLTELFEIARGDSKIILDEHLNTPKTLFATTRNSLRKFYGKSIHIIANQHYLPTRIGDSLLLKDVLEHAYCQR